MVYRAELLFYIGCRVTAPNRIISEWKTVFFFPVGEECEFPFVIAVVFRYFVAEFQGFRPNVLFSFYRKVPLRSYVNYVVNLSPHEWEFSVFGQTGVDPEPDSPVSLLQDYNNPPLLKNQNMTCDWLSKAVDVKADAVAPSPHPPGVKVNINNWEKEKKILSIRSISLK